MFILGVFFFKFEGKDCIVVQLFDEVGIVIDIFMFYIFGCDDVFLSLVVVLFNVCEFSKVIMYDYGFGYIVFCDVENVGVLGEILQEIMFKVEEGNRWVVSEQQQRKESGFSGMDKSEFVILGEFYIFLLV